MQVQLRVYVMIWPCCKDVRIDGERVRCVLDYGRAYDLMDSYVRAPHSEFLNIKGEESLAKFLEQFGPLYLVYKDGSSIYHPRESLPEAVGSTAVYWGLQRWLRSLLRLIESLKQARRVRQAVMDFLDADISCYKTNHSYRLKGPPGTAIAVLKTARSTKSTTLQEWLREVDDSVIREAAAAAIQASISVEARLRVALAKRKAEVSASFVFRSLGDALEWMCWQDVFQERPLVFCKECSQAFRPVTAHVRKFCSEECGHRVAARNWRRKDLEMKRRLKRKERANSRVIDVKGKDEQ